MNLTNDNFSVDMIRFEFNLNRHDIEHLIKTVLKNEINPYVKHWEKFGFKDYKYHFVYDDGKQNFWLAYEFLLKDKLTDSSRTLVIEYNPNKNSLDGILLRILKALTVHSRRSGMKLKGFDIAIDLKGVPRNNVFYSRGYYKHSLDYVENNSKTSYIGKRGWGGTKIYDKAKEQNLNGDWTRVEFTIKLTLPLFELDGIVGDFYKSITPDFIDMSIPNIYIIDSSTIQDPRYRSYLFAIECGYVDINEFSRHTKDKIRQLLNDSSDFVIDDRVKPLICTCIINYLDHWVHVASKDMPF